jgi:hypothetical protein
MKRTKNQVSRDASLPHWPLPCKSGKTTGCNTFAHLSHKPTLQQKFANALPAAQAICFTRFHPKLIC